MATAAQRAELARLIATQNVELPIELHDGALWQTVVEAEDYELLQKEKIGEAAELRHTEAFTNTVALLLDGFSMEEVAQEIGWESVQWMKHRMVYIARQARAKRH